MKKNYSQKGFTIIELLLYVSIAGIILFSVSGFLSVLLESRVKNQTIAEVEQQGAQAMQMITQTLRNGVSLTTPAFGATSTSLSLTTPIALNNPTVWSLFAGAIQMKEGTQATSTLTNARVTVSGLVFSNLSATSTMATTTRIRFTVTSVAPTGRQEYSYSEIFTGSATLRP